MVPTPTACMEVDNGDGQQSRRRMASVLPEHGGKPCSEHRYEVRGCDVIADEEHPVEQPAIDPEPRTRTYTH